MAMASAAFVGILPAAGLATRLRPLRYAKELLPIAYERDPDSGGVRPVPVAEYSLGAMRHAGVRRCIMIIADRKTEMVRYFGNGSHVGVSIAYVEQPEPLGLAAAVDETFPWISGCNVCLALPDTVFEPRSALDAVCRSLVANGADLTLGVFPTNRPDLLGPVRIGDDARVLDVLEKPAVTELRNTWGIAAWSPRFSDFLHDATPHLHGQSIGDVFNAAAHDNLDVRAVTFNEGRYLDVGTVHSLGDLVLSDGNNGDEWQLPLPGLRYSSVG